MNPTVLTSGNSKVVCVWGDDNVFELRCGCLESGIHSVEFTFDMESFDWERLYMPMTKYANHGQRTGPWDFDLYNDNVPLIPTWKLHRDGEYIGLLHMQRLTIEEMESKKTRAEFSFLVGRSKPKETNVCADVCFRGKPFNDFKLRPIAVVLERHPFDILERQPWAERGLAANWAWNIPGPDGWNSLAAKIAGSPFERMLERLMDSETLFEKNGGNSKLKTRFLTLASMLCRLRGDDALKSAILDSVDELLARPVWGNQNLYGYGHNGDMGCAETIKQLSVVYNWLHDDLGARRPLLLERLSRQMGLFLEQQLLFAEYWGGARSQDHGFRSTLMVASAAINMLGYSSEAAASLEFLIPRMRRVLEKLPLDGYIPFAQYHTISLCVNALCEFRLAYLFASGNDVFDITSAFGGIPCYILSTYDEQSMSVFTSCTRGDRKDFKDSLSFFMMTEEKYVCRISAYLRSCIMEHYLRESRGKLSPSVLATIPSAILAWNGTEFTSSAKPEFEALNVFQDGGGVHYRFDPARFTVAVMCHPNAPSHHSIGTDMNSTDRALSNPSSGAFSVAVGDEVLIQNAESGYRTGSELGNVLLVDGRGQIGDVGYPMGVPMRRWRGDRIQSWRTAEDGDGGFARLLLTAAYPDESGVLRYTRDFHFDGASTRVVDTVVSSEKHNFEYRFNTYQDHDIERLSDTEFVIRGAEAALNLSISSADWDVSIADTDVVWSYVNEHDGRPFKHLRIALRKPVEAFALEFVVNSV